METIAIISRKGGAGKTTLAVGLAVAADASGRPAVVLDLDPQASALAWSQLRQADNPPVLAAKAAQLDNLLGTIRAAGAELAFIDTAPSVANTALLAARAADCVLIPCRPSVADLTAIDGSVQIAVEAGKPAIAVINAAAVRSPLIAQAESALRQYGMGVAPIVHQRIAHVHAFTAGLAASETGYAGKAAGSEMGALFDWLFEEVTS